MTSEEALAFVADRGVVLQGAKGPVPNLVEAIAGESISGSWWAHPLSHEMYSLIWALRGSSDILVCRVVQGKVTYVHRRLWPALARLAPEIDDKLTASIDELHTASGRHRVVETQFSDWLPNNSADQSKALGRQEAIDQMGSWVLTILNQ